MKSEEKQIKRMLPFIFLFFLVYFSAIRMASLFQCARQQNDADLPVDPLGNSYGDLTPFFGFPLNLLQAQSPSVDNGIIGLAQMWNRPQWFVYGPHHRQFFRRCSPAHRKVFPSSNAIPIPISWFESTDRVGKT